MKALPLLVICIFHWLLHAVGQEYGYTHYGNIDGLSGSTVYCMTQDKEGFLWFGTETGLSRFDGTHFKNYFKQQGLPDNEIIQLFADSKGRVWIAPFKSSVCYYYKGNIYNQYNDSSLRGIKVKDNIVRFAEDEDGNIVMQEVNRLHLLTVHGKIREIDSINGTPIRYCGMVAPRTAGGFWVMNSDTVFTFTNNAFRFAGRIDCRSVHFNTLDISDESLIRASSSFRFSRTSLIDGSTVHFPKDQALVNNTIRITNFSDSSIAWCTIDGMLTMSKKHQTVIERFLPGISVTNVLRDSEGNIWFSTVGKGIYRLNSPFVKNIRIRKHNATDQDVQCMAKYKNTILVGSDIHRLYRLDAATGARLKNDILLPNYTPDPIVSIFVWKEQTITYATRRFMFKLSPQLKWQYKIDPINVKSLFLYNDRLYAATARHVLVIDPENLAVTDTIWHGRATSVFVATDTVYIGTLNGLYFLPKGQVARFAGDTLPLLRNRISGITMDRNDVLWVATYGEGLLAYKAGRIIAHINKQNGLTSNICRTIFLQDSILWVGTDKGLNRINVGHPHYSVHNFTTGDGLVSDIINTVYVTGSKVFVGTAEGITFFDEQKINRLSRCDLLFTDISVSGEPWQWNDSSMVIPHEKNNIRFDYVGISYKSAGDIRYRYRLLGLDTVWRETRETFLSYPTLPSGDYELQLQAINKFGVYSTIITAKFTIEKLWWEKTILQLLMALAFLGLVALLVRGIIHRVRRREQEKTAIGKRIVDLEQLARKAQMNPHFIFNSLNSIQQYVMDADLAGANKFISGFSKLIRQTLDFSSRQTISLEEEIGYLTNYLDLEKARLENAFSWTVELANGINPAEYYLPPMLLQPFVENSVRHGLRLRKDKNGQLTVSIKKENNYLTCVVEDNGVGRKVAQLFKSRSHIEYQSKGMALTTERIAILNMENVEKITLQIDDLEDGMHQAMGTRVTIQLPVKD